MMFFEMLALAQRNDEIATELAELGRRTRRHVADTLQAKHDAGVLKLRADPDAASAFLFALADGLLVRRLSEPELGIGPVMAQAVSAARAILS
jgi:hypothetical protein